MSCRLPVDVLAFDVRAGNETCAPTELCMAYFRIIRSDSSPSKYIEASPVSSLAFIEKRHTDIYLDAVDRAWRRVTEVPARPIQELQSFSS